MSRRKVMYVPSNFTAQPDSDISFKDCRFYSRDMFLWVEANCYKESFGKQEEIKGWDIISEDSVPVFRDKLDTYTGKQEERLV